MYQNINLNVLKYFYEVANTKNITKASINLNITQPALTRAIKQLEDELNKELFVRNKKGVVLTPEGEILYEYTKKMLKSLNSILNTIEDTSNQNKTLYIGVTTTNFLEPIESSLRKFRKKHPNVHINIILEDISIIENHSRLEKMDIVVKTDYEYMKDLEVIKTFTVEDKFIASKEQYNDLEGKILSVKDILNYPTVLLSDITHGRKNFDSYIKSLGISYKPTYEFNSHSLCKRLIKDGYGIGIGNPKFYNDEDFLVLETNFQLPKRTFDICYVKTSTNPLLNEIVELLKQSLENKNL